MKPIKIKKSYAASFSPNGDLCLVLGRDVILWNISKREKVWTVHPFSHPSECAFSANGASIAIKNTSGETVLLSLTTGEPIRGFSSPAIGEGSNLIFSPDSRVILDGSWEGVLNARDANTGQVIWTKSYWGEMICRIVTSPELSWVLTEHHPKSTGSSEIPKDAYFLKWSWPIEKSKPKEMKLSFPFLKCAKLSNDGKRIAVIFGAPPKTLSVYDLDSRELLWTTSVQYAGSGIGLAWSPDGSRLASTEKTGVAIFNSADGTRERVYNFGYPSDVEFSPSGEFLALCSWNDGSIVSLLK